MSTKPSEQFHSTLIAQYKDMIHEALLESDHKMFLDEDLFEEKLQVIMTAAKMDGLSKQEVLSLVEEAKREAPHHEKVS
jgi:hypothetical protein